ncbi:NADPH:quinone reductase-like Zn-dependent oxidoreductase [Saccharothrix tamanrassetensis]|uniref:NADPH:quinone reductase-like Zn-dependent oxidoreductase n=1 Tax=Saccharothrix tamanrassetensis TaxID=1051531 RepID=A0A841CR77_9PSEU|nr:zinc-dependent alcohol dehydrogenase family protein [Saccharothrix tamanrassetensis]MBB5959799.1 NADPH:quinone reductase-like Zn-dependent oxidoreductase [Saccharothrix tamanrassetensis]
MRSVVFSRHGPASRVVALTGRPRPRPGAGEVLVRVRARPVNPSDELYVEGRYGRRPALPAVPGFEGVGTVEETTTGSPAVGQRVAVSAQGTWQEYVVVPEADLIPVPDRLPDHVACQLTVNPLTALLLTRRLALRAGDWLLITAAGSALSRMVLHLVRRDDVRCVCVVRDDRHDDLTRAGASAVVNAATDDVVGRVREVTGGEGVHAVLDAVGGEPGSTALRCLRSGGQAVVLGMLDGGTIGVTPHALVFSDLTIRGFWLPYHLSRQSPEVRAELAERAIDLLSAPGFAAPVAATYDLDDVAAALDHVHRPGRHGKVILTG